MTDRPNPQRTRTIIDRLNIDGLREYFASRGKLSKSIWFSITVLAYFSAAYFSYLTALRFDIGRTAVFIELDPSSKAILIPSEIVLCHTVFWNKTYLEENIEIPEDIFQKASKLGLYSKSQILSKFAKYISYYNVFHFDEEEEENLRPDVWDLMTELYEITFRNDVHFADLVADAAIRSNMIETCWYIGKRFKCDRAISYSVESPGCHQVPVQELTTNHTSIGSTFDTSDLDRATLKFEISLPIDHIFGGDNKSGRDGMQNLGIKLLFTAAASQFHPQWATPANTHAVFSFHHREKVLRSNCIPAVVPLDPEFAWSITYESCLMKVFEIAARNLCGCHFIGGSYYPRNKLACTPNQIRQCVQKHVLGLLSDGNQTYGDLIQKCQRRCWTDDIIATVSYYDLEDVSTDRIKNVITVRPNLDQGVCKRETNLTNIYGAFSEVGGVVGVYTGLSIAAFVRLFALIGGVWLEVFNRRIMKPFLSKLSHTPLSVRWDMISLIIYRRLINLN